MKVFRTLVALAAAGSVSLSAADLTNVATAKRWNPAECTVVQAGKAMTVNMPIDHKAGEKKYPIGWPRLYLEKITPAEKDWSKAKAVSFKIKLEFTGKTAKYPVSFQVKTKGPKETKNATKFFTIPGLVNNKTVTAVLPLKDVKNLDNVVCLGFNISESQYKHGENLKFTVSDFKLINK
ncbi:MAG: hypothetical protein IJV93_08435 [Lentisphaeria bacterium]|nr:hypothetical protein [Lentisphaeria bacterium]